MKMKFNLISVGMSFILVIFFTLAWKVMNYVWWRPKKLERWLREQGFNGNPYRLWHGDLKETRKMIKEAWLRPINLSDDLVPNIMPFEHQLLEKYGKKAFKWNGPTPRVIIMDPRMIRDVLLNYMVFQKPFSPQTRMLLSGLLVHEGDHWARLRKAVNPAFTVERLKHMLPAMSLSCTEIMGKWDTLVSERGGSCEVDVWPHLQNLTADVISRTAFGSSYQEGTRIFQLLRQLAQLIFQISQWKYIPGWRFLPTKTNKRMKDIHNEVNGLLKDIVNRRVKALRAGEANKDDLLGILIESNFKEIQEHGNTKNTELTIEEVIDECRLFYFAGQETTSKFLLWTMLVLAEHKKWQTLAREEVLRVFGNNKPHFHGLSHLKIITMILNEVLRLYPPAALVSRIIYEKTKLGDITLPAGVELLLPIILVHHDKELWGDDAKEFKPERFSEGVAKATKGQVSFFPFSSGPRICIGQNFAMIEAKLAMAMILQQFSFELSPSYVHGPFSILALQPQCGAKLILSKI